MSQGTLSVCMIVKNEEKHLNRCLRSASTFADEIIIVDTGSTDNTLDIAKRYNSKIYHYKWNDNFSDARNESLKHATKDWILVLDADEEVTYEEGLKLKSILNQYSQYEGFHCRLVNLIDKVDIGDAIVLRIFKNKPDYKFEGKMHEQVVQSITSKHGPNCLIGTDIKILHYGYDPNLSDMKIKQQRNFDLLSSYPEDQRDGYFYYSFGNEYARINQPDKALEIYDKALNYPLDPNVNYVYMPYLYQNISKLLNGLGRYAEEIKMLKEFESKFPNFKDLYFLEYSAQLNCGHITEAKECLLKYREINNDRYEFPNSRFDQQYNIDTLLNNLNNLNVSHPKNLLSVLILLDSNNDKVVDTIRSVNEIADEVVVVASNNLDYNFSSVENIGAKVILVNSDDNGNIFLEGLKNCTCDYILLLKTQEFCSVDTLKQLVHLLKFSKNNYYNLYKVNKTSTLQSTEFRLFKNEKSLTNYITFNDLATYIHSKPIEDVNIYIHEF